MQDKLIIFGRSLLLFFTNPVVVGIKFSKSEANIIMKNKLPNLEKSANAGDELLGPGLSRLVFVAKAKRLVIIITVNTVNLKQLNNNCIHRCSDK